MDQKRSPRRNKQIYRPPPTKEKKEYNREIMNPFPSNASWGSKLSTSCSPHCVLYMIFGIFVLFRLHSFWLGKLCFKSGHLAWDTLFSVSFIATQNLARKSEKLIAPDSCHCCYLKRFHRPEGQPLACLSSGQVQCTHEGWELSCQVAPKCKYM